MSKKVETGLLILRVVVGIIFLAHGVAKFQSGLGNIAGWFDSIGLPGMLAYAVAVLEAAGGALLILGLGTRIFAVLFAVIMLGAIVKVKAANGLLGNGTAAGYEFELALLAASAALALTGGGLYSLQSMFGQKANR